MRTVAPLPGAPEFVYPEFERQFIDQLAIPGKPDRDRSWVRGKPAVVMPAALAQSPAIGGERHAVDVLRMLIEQARRPAPRRSRCC